MPQHSERGETPPDAVRASPRRLLVADPRLASPRPSRSKDEGWVPSITVKQILMGIQDLLTDPNPNSPAQTDAYLDYTKNRDKYELRVKKQVEKFPPKFLFGKKKKFSSSCCCCCCC